VFGINKKKQFFLVSKTPNSLKYQISKCSNNPSGKKSKNTEISITFFLANLLLLPNYFIGAELFL
jgi:hypothetical protein